MVPSVVVILLFACASLARQDERGESFMFELTNVIGVAHGYFLNMDADDVGFGTEELGHIGTTVSGIVESEVIYTDDRSFLLFPQSNITLNYSCAYDYKKDYLNLTLSWKAPKDQILQDCFLLNDKNWYGGPVQEKQDWPLENQAFSTNYHPVTPRNHDGASIIEPYFLNSKGQFIYVRPQVPLWVSIKKGPSAFICLVASIEAWEDGPPSPYSKRREYNELTYDFIVTKNARSAHNLAVLNVFKTPSETPDHRMIRYPNWITTADQRNVKRLFKVIKSQGFQSGQLEISNHNWENCHGSSTVNKAEFKDMKGLVEQLKSDNFSVTLWVHPFIDRECSSYSEANKTRYFVSSANGNTSTCWKYSKIHAGYVDFTNPRAANWWKNRVNEIKSKYGFDGFNCDAGESEYSPLPARLTGDVYSYPNQLTVDYVQLCAKEFGKITKIGTGAQTQELPVFIRMKDKESTWDGLKYVIPTLLTLNINGYIFILPTRIGNTTSHELFIRWLQMTTFMPAMEFGAAQPFLYGNLTTALSKKFVKLHAVYSDKIIEIMEKYSSTGTPVNPPIWWVDPEDKTALTIADEYLLGESVLVAPVLQEGARTRDVYLPAGIWQVGYGDKKNHTGKKWLRNFHAPLSTLPFFIRVGDMPSFRPKSDRAESQNRSSASVIIYCEIILPLILVFSLTGRL